MILLRYGRRGARSTFAGAGIRRRRCECCATTSTRRWPRTRRTWSCTEARGGRHETGTASADRRGAAELGDDETLLIQSGKPVGVFRTHPDAPRVLIANSLPGGTWATWDEFWRARARGLTMFGQMTAGSWIYIGSQGIVQGTFETFAAPGETHWRSLDSPGEVLSAGLGGMGGAQPLAATMAGAARLNVEMDPHASRGGWKPVPGRVAPRPGRCGASRAARREEGIALHRPAGQRRRRVPGAGAAGCPVHLVTDQTSAHDLLNGYVPRGMDFDDARPARIRPAGVRTRRARIAVAHVTAMVGFQQAGSQCSTTATTCAPGADAGYADALRIRDLCPPTAAAVLPWRRALSLGGALG